MTTELNERISPEGLEERIIRTEEFTIRQTQGGKFRIYHGEQSVKVVDTKEEAIKTLGTHMLFLGSFITDPRQTLEVLFKNKR